MAIYLKTVRHKFNSINPPPVVTTFIRRLATKFMSHTPQPHCVHIYSVMHLHLLYVRPSGVECTCNKINVLRCILHVKLQLYKSETVWMYFICKVLMKCQPYYIRKLTKFSFFFWYVRTFTYAINAIIINNKIGNQLLNRWKT